MRVDLVRIGVTAVVAAAISAAAGAGPTTFVNGQASGPAAAADQRPTLGDINRVEDLQVTFDADRGKPRIVLLLSPT